MPSPMQRPTSPNSANATALVVLAGLLVLGIVAAVFALRGTGVGVQGLFDRAQRIVGDLRKEQPAPEAAAPDAPPAAADAPPADGAEPPAARARADTALQRIRDTVAECMPTLMQFAQNVRLIAADITSDNLDLVQESASVPGRFVRMSCDWDGRSPCNISDNGRMVV